MPDFHQPDDHDRRMAERRGAAAGTVGDWAERADEDALRRSAMAAGVPDADTRPRSELVEALRERRPSSRNDPNAPERPRT